MYLDGKEADGYASPALAEDLSGLPPAYIMVGQPGPFRDEAITYARRLLDAGVSVELHVIPGGFHGFGNAMKDTPLARRRVRDEYIGALSEALK